MQKSNVYSIVLIAALLFLGMLLAPFHIMQHDLSMIPGDFIDTRFNNYMLEHGYRWLTGQVAHFWDAQYCYPVPDVTAFSDSHLGLFWLYSLFRFADFDRETSLQLWIIVMFALNYLSSAYALRKMEINALGVAVGSFIFAFSMPVMGQMIHIQLLPRFLVPLIVLFTVRFLDRPGVFVLFKLCLAIVAQFYCTFYIGYLSVLAVIALVIGYVLLNFRDRRELPFFTDFTRDIWKKLGVAAGSALLLLPAMLPYLPVVAKYGYRRWEEIALMLPRFSSYFFPPDGTLLWDWLKPLGHGLPMPWDHYLFVGAFPIAAVIVLIIMYLRSSDRDSLLKWGFVAVITLAILTVITLSVRNVSLYRLVYKLIPGLSSVRSLARIILVDLFFLSMISGIVITRCSRLLSGKSPVIKGVVALIVISVFAVDQYVVIPDSFSKKEAQERSRNVEDLMMKQNPSAIIYAYIPQAKKWSLRTVFADHIDAMMAAQSLNKYTVNAYSGQLTTELQNMLVLPLYPREVRCLALRRWGRATELLYNKKDWYRKISIVDPGDTAPCPASRFTELDFSGIDHPLDDAACNAEITFDRPVHTIDRYDVYVMEVKVKNRSAVTWPVLGDGTGKYAVGLTYRWLGSDRKPLTGYDQKVYFLYDLKPRETMRVSVPVYRPFDTGEYHLEFDVFQDSVLRFQDKGSRTSMVKIVATGLGDSGFTWK